MRGADRLAAIEDRLERTRMGDGAFENYARAHIALVHRGEYDHPTSCLSGASCDALLLAQARTDLRVLLDVARAAKVFADSFAEFPEEPGCWGPHIDDLFDALEGLDAPASPRATDGEP